MNRVSTAALLVALIAAACGGGTSGDESETAQTVTTSAAAETTTTAAPTTTTTTSAPGTTEASGTATSPVVPGEDADVDAIVEAYLVVFDSTTSYEEKAPYITDPAGLEDTVIRYAAAGEDVGGIALSADEVGIDGDAARVIYSFLFAGNPAYTDLEGEAVRTDAGWQVTRDFFCDIMSSARVGCSS